MADLNTVGESKQFNYTGGVQSINLLPGTYKLECYGARGGYNGGLGGKSIGYYVAKIPTTLYIVCGGQGANNSGTTYGAGGYNGGGRGGNSSNGYAAGAGGGGATHIAITNRGILANYSSYKNEVLIVAGGGGGAGSWYGSGNGYGGGLSGNNVSAYNGVIVQGGTQTTGYAFGQGQPGGNANGGSGGSEGNGGGGGGWYGGYAYQATGSNTNCVGAGGSGYIGGVLDTVTINNVIYTSTTTGNINTGNGYVIITFLKKGNFIICKDCVSSIDSYENINEIINFDVYTDKLIIRDNIIYYVSDLKFTPNNIIMQKIDKTHYQFSIPPHSAYQIYIDAVLEKVRFNSDIYKDPYPDAAFDFKLLFKEDDLII